MSELDLALDAGGWVRFLIGLPFLLGPGIALADRWLPGDRARFLLAPVASLSILGLTVFALESFLGVPPTPRTSFIASIVLTAWIGAPRIRRWADEGILLPRATRQGLKTTAALAVTVAFVMLVQSLPHLPGAAPESGLDVYPELASRAQRGVEGDDYPYPIHVDEHIHFAYAAKAIRDETIQFNEVYYNVGDGTDVLSFGGLRTERGFTLALVQIHDLLGVPLAALFRFLPAIWAGSLASLTWMALRPAPGALTGAAFVAVLPSTARFLGIGFLVSSPFGLPWILATLILVLRGRGAARFFGTMLLLTTAFFQHLVIGTLSLAAAIVAMLVISSRRADRLGIIAATAVPLVWILPSVWGDAVDAVSAGSGGGLPFEPRIFAVPGILFYVAAITGTLLAFMQPTRNNAVHRSLVVLGTLMAMSMAWSVLNDHHNDGTYARQLFAFLLSMGAVASIGLGRLGTAVKAWRPGWAKVAVCLATLIILVVPLRSHLGEGMYRIHDDVSWAAGQTFADSGAGPDNRFLSHPWQAPLFSAATGAAPHTVLYPGAPPANQADWEYYVASGGANQTWLQDRGIDFVVRAPTPNAPHEALGNGVYQLT